MPRTANLDPIRAVIHDLGQQIGQELATAITQSFTDALEGRAGAAARVVGASVRPSPAGASARAAVSSGTPCAVAGCARKVAAKGLCQNHYAKAKRLKLNLDNLSPANLETLGQDGRALRFKREASALVRRKSKSKS